MIVAVVLVGGACVSAQPADSPRHARDYFKGAAASQVIAILALTAGGGE